MASNNRLLNEYNQYNYHSGQFSNKLLQQNPNFINQQNNQQMQHIQQMQMQKMREQQQIRQIEKINELESTMGKDYKEKIKEAVIQPVKIDKSATKKELETKWKQAEQNYFTTTKDNKKQYGPEIQKYWQSRTNESYKTIIKDKIPPKQIKDDKDLIVHKVTKKDKEGVDNDFQKMNVVRKKHNSELDVVYAKDKETEHKKKFDYTHVYKYRIQYDPKSHGELKQDKVKYYKEQQKQEEEKKQLKDSILECLVNDSIFSPDELKDFKSTDNKQSKKEAYLARNKK